MVTQLKNGRLWVNPKHTIKVKDKLPLLTTEQFKELGQFLGLTQEQATLLGREYTKTLKAAQNG